MSAIKLASDTLIGTPAGGNIEYNGQFFATDSNNARAQLGRLVLETAKTATGTSVDFTGIPSWVKRITVMFDGVSTNGTSNLQLQIGSGSFITTGYNGGGNYILSNNTGAGGTNSTGFVIAYSVTATDVRSGILVLTLISGNTWAFSGNSYDSTNLKTMVSAGRLALSNTLDRIRITTVNGTDTFDAGSINILYEG
jgi:hypothetical protein